MKEIHFCVCGHHEDFHNMGEDGNVKCEIAGCFCREWNEVPSTLDDIFPDFEATFLALLEQVLNSGAVDDGATLTEISRCVLQITAEKYAPVSKSNQRLLKNLRHFI